MKGIAVPDESAKHARKPLVTSKKEGDKETVTETPSDVKPALADLISQVREETGQTKTVKPEENPPLDAVAEPIYYVKAAFFDPRLGSSKGTRRDELNNMRDTQHRGEPQRKGDATSVDLAREFITRAGLIEKHSALIEPFARAIDETYGMEK